MSEPEPYCRVTETLQYPSNVILPGEKFNPVNSTSETSSILGASQNQVKIRRQLFYKFRFEFVLDAFNFHIY